MIDCRECREELPEFVLGRLDAAPGDPVSDHLATCPACRQAAAELGDLWAALPLGLPGRQPPADLFDRVMARVNGETVPRAQPAGATLTRRQRLLSYALAGSVLLALAGAYATWLRPGADGDQAARQSVENLARRLGKLQELERLFAAEQVRLVSLHGPATPASAEAFVVWDIAAGQWHFYARRLPPAPAGRAYQIWSARADATFVAGPTFQVNDEGIGSVVVDLPDADPRHAARAVVTLEPIGGSQQPTGEILLEAAL